MGNNIPITEELDFHYLLGLMPPLKDVPEFEWLPELFALIGEEKFINLCKYAGGETIRIPTIEELDNAISALQWFYDVYIKEEKLECGIPYRLMPLVNKVKEVYDARDRQAEDTGTSDKDLP